MVKLSSKLTMWPGENVKAIAQTKTGDIAISIGVLVLSDTWSEKKTVARGSEMGSATTGERKSIGVIKKRVYLHWSS